MTISVTCQCGTILEAEDQHAGRKGRCSKCGAKLTLPQPVKPARDPEVTFAEYKPTIADDTYRLGDHQPIPEPRPFFPPPTAPAPTPPAPPEFSDDGGRSDELELDSGAFRRHFFAVWWCHWVLRIMGLLILGLWAAGLALAIVLGVVVLIQSKDAMTLGGMAALAMVWVPGFLLSVTTGFCLLAAAELLTAASWNYLRRGIGGLGPIDG
ncbi:MAG TPA: hypothetical protein VM165_19005 [Planctomycetaceae bacterium]|nr:hypothetical protein [Planctomycetaceae bacterium]